MNIEKLVQSVGIENIQMQNLDHAAINLDWDHKKGTRITFGTEAALNANGTEKLGLILWFDRASVAAALSNSERTDG